MKLGLLALLAAIAAWCAVVLWPTPQRGGEPAARRYTRADTLRGMLTKERSCYDVLFYHLDVKIDPSAKTVRGSNLIRFCAVTDMDTMQVDLFPMMGIDSVISVPGGQRLVYRREFGAVFIGMLRTVPAGSIAEIRIHYGGAPQVAANPPWLGGFTWSRDAAGNPWVAVTCQGTGASLWWPNKDHQSDEPDSMLLSVTVPQGLMDISNGRLRRVQELEGGWSRYDWFVSSPINNYNVTVNIGRFASFSDVYRGADTLSLDYYVLPENLTKAREQFKQVKLMLAAFEKYFGPYPFPRDGYKLVESPHLGMEHQGAIAYGNGYLQGYRGRASSAAGLTFDFIIIHESAHEWWGNSITSKDIADMWIHESFGAYAEALFVEEYSGREAALEYINAKKNNVRNRNPIIGVYNVQQEGSGDMYDKGQLVLNTLRSVLGSDSLWFGILRGLAREFSHRTVTAEDVIGFISRAAGQDLRWFFDQYLRHTAVPVLEVHLVKKGEGLTARYRWRADVQEFRMPVRITTAGGGWGIITPTTSWQTTSLGTLDPRRFRMEEDRYYAQLRVSVTYLDPRINE